MAYPAPQIVLTAQYLEPSTLSPRAAPRLAQGVTCARGHGSLRQASPPQQLREIAARSARSSSKRSTSPLSQTTQYCEMALGRGSLRVPLSPTAPTRELGPVSAGLGGSFRVPGGLSPPAQYREFAPVYAGGSLRLTSQRSPTASHRELAKASSRSSLRFASPLHSPRSPPPAAAPGSPSPMTRPPRIQEYSSPLHQRPRSTLAPRVVPPSAVMKKPSVVQLSPAMTRGGLSPATPLCATISGSQVASVAALTPKSVSDTVEMACVCTINDAPRRFVWPAIETRESSSATCCPHPGDVIVDTAPCANTGSNLTRLPSGDAQPHTRQSSMTTCCATWNSEAQEQEPLQRFLPRSLPLAPQLPSEADPDSPRSDAGFTNFTFEEARAEDLENQARHEVFGWLKWGPSPGTPCYNALHRYFPGALPGEVVHARCRSLLESDKFAFTSQNTIFGTSICPDEVNSVNGAMVEIMRDHWGGTSFPLGGISGAPFAGKLGFGAFSNHVPDDGNVLLVFGPHVSISEDGEVGKIYRRGVAKKSSACEHVIGAYNACISGQGVEFDKSDMQMSWIKSQIAPYAERIKACENPMAVLAHQAYEFVKDMVMQVVNNDFGKGHLAILGGIMVNMPQPYSDHFLPLMFQISKKDYTPQDFMTAFRSRLSGEVFRDDFEAQRRTYLYGRILERVDMFAKVSHDEILHAARSVVSLTFFKGEYLTQEGHQGSSFFILLCGEAVCTVSGKHVHRYRGCLQDLSGQSISKFLEQSDLVTSGKVASFGDIGFTGAKKAASVRVTSPKAVVLTISREVYDMVVKNAGQGEKSVGKCPDCRWVPETVQSDLPAPRRRSVVAETELEVQTLRAKDCLQATHHYVFSYLNWSPEPDSACYRALHDQFPCAIPGPAFFSRSILALEKFGFAPSNTIFGTSLCPDEINSRKGGLVHQMQSYWGENFPLGGVLGAPFAGKTGFVAFSRHVPDNGNVIVLFGSHVGISIDGAVGKVLRDGQQHHSASCGAAVGAYNECLSSCSSEAEFDKADMQMEWIKLQLAPHAHRIKDQEDPMAALAHKAYGIVADEVDKVVSTDFGDGYLALIGVIQINMPKPYYDHFLPVKFEVRNRRDSYDVLRWMGASEFIQESQPASSSDLIKTWPAPFISEKVYGA